MSATLFPTPSFNTTTLLYTPVNPSDAVTKAYVDSALGGSGAPFLPLAGGTVTGAGFFNGGGGRAGNWAESGTFTGGTYNSATIGGAWTGAPTWSGNHIFSGNPQFQGLLNVRNPTINTLALNLGTATVGNDISFNGALGHRRAINWQTASVSRWRAFIDGSDNWVLGAFGTTGGSFAGVLTIGANPVIGGSNSTFTFGNTSAFTQSGTGTVGYNFKHAYTGTLTGNLAVWQSIISSDTVDATNRLLRGAYFSHSFGGGSAAGGRIGLQVDFFQVGALSGGSNAAVIVNGALNNPGGTSWAALDSQLVGQNWNLELQQGARYVGVYKAQGEVDFSVDGNTRVVTVGAGSPNGTTYNLSFTTTAVYQTNVGAPISVPVVISTVGGASDTPTTIASKLLAGIMANDSLNQGGVGASSGQIAGVIYTTGSTRAFSLAYADWVGMTCTPSVSGGVGTLTVGAEVVGAGCGALKGTMYVIGGNQGVRGMTTTSMMSLHGSPSSAAVGMLSNILRVEVGPGGGGTWPLDPFATGFMFSPGVSVSTASFSIPQNQVRMFSFADMRRVNFTASAGFPWLSPGFALDGAGNHQIGGSLISRTTSGLAINAPGWEGTAVINSGGSGTIQTAYFIGDIGSDAFGGQYQATAVSVAGVITAMTTLVAPSAPAGSAPAATQAVSGGSGSGWTVTVTWNALTNVAIGATAVDTIIGKQSAGAAGDTLGHLLIPFVAGTPTGVPTNAAKGTAMRYDTSGHKIWFYDTGTNTWRGVAVI